VYVLAFKLLNQRPISTKFGLEVKLLEAIQISYILFSTIHNNNGIHITEVDRDACGN
jgi:hypothetical protein